MFPGTSLSLWVAGRVNRHLAREHRDRGDAPHEFPRASFGTPQSLGCVELPEAAAAAAIWPYTPIGTLVTIES